MSTLKIQQEILENKRRKGFNTTNVEQEFCYLYGEVGEAYDAYYKQGDVADELADIAIFLLGIAEILGVDLGAEVIKKVNKNKNRTYKFNELGKPVKMTFAERMDAENVTDYAERALRYAEEYGIIEYDVKGKFMYYKEVLRIEGTINHEINLDTFEHRTV